MNAATEEGGKDGSRLGISHREVNGRLVLSGVLRVYWGIENSIRLREFDDRRPIAMVQNRKDRDRKAMSVAAGDIPGVSFPES